MEEEDFQLNFAIPLAQGEGAQETEEVEEG